MSDGGDKPPGWPGRRTDVSPGDRMSWPHGDEGEDMARAHEIAQRMQRFGPAGTIVDETSVDELNPSLLPPDPYARSSHAAYPSIPPPAPHPPPQAPVSPSYPPPFASHPPPLASHPPPLASHPPPLLSHPPEEVAPRSSLLPDIDGGRRRWGGALLALGCLLGIALNLYVFVLPQQASSQADLGLVIRAALFAYLPVVLYLCVPYVVDRYDPEPWWALAGVFAWGALAATGLSAIVFMQVSAYAGDFYATALSAPVSEELAKGLAIFGMAYFLRREFDGVVDGIIYGTFVGIGFAATENIVYYSRYQSELHQVFILRGVLTPWLHPLFGAMTGIGFGLAREHGARTAKILFPLGGYVAAVLLHAWWNGIPQLYPDAFALNLVVGLVMAVAFFVLLCALVYRKGQTIRRYLEDEVLIGTIDEAERDLIASYGGRLRARLTTGKAGAEFVAAGARLALCKWHLARATKRHKRTISADFIGPLRRELARLRTKMRAAPS